MKHKIKILLVILLCCMLAFVGVFSYVSIKNANAVTTSSDTSHVVNFYGADNKTVIYSVNVENGKTLNDLQNSNLIFNSYFSSIVYKNYINSASDIFNNFDIGGGWFLQSNSYNSVFSSVNSVLPSYGSFGVRVKRNDFGFTYIQYYLTKPVIGQTYYFISSVNNVVYSYSYSFDSLPDTYSVIYLKSSSSDFPFFIRFEFLGNLNSDNYFSINIGVGFSYLADFSVDYVYFGLDNVSYFNSNYVNQLYINSGGVVGDNFEWSESPTSSSRFNFDTPITSDINLYGYTASGQVFDYDGFLSSDYSNYGNYAIDSVEFLEVSGVPVYHLVFNVANFTNEELLYIYSDYVSSPAPNLNSSFNSFILNSSNSSQFFSIFGYIEGDYSFNLVSYLNGQSAQYSINVPNGSNTLVHLYFAPSRFSALSYNSFTFESNYFTNRYYNGVDAVVDMSGDTNFSFDISVNYDESSLNNDFLNYLFYYESGGFLKSFSLFGEDIYNFNFYTYTNNNWSNRNVPVTNITVGGGNPLDTFTDNIFVSDCFFFVHKPSYRVDNTLVIYNFDYYNLLYSADYISYQLQRNGALYNVNYNGSVDNTYFIYLSNDNVNNTQFDEYVSVSIGFLNNLLPFVHTDNSTYTCDLGFDFNFTYYVQPLVSNNGIYNYTFEKPGYVEMPFSLYPFYIPVLEIVQNAFIFLLFYCPIFSDVVELLNFDMFFGSLLNIFDFITTSAIGEFVYACLGFLIFWSLLKGFFPALVSSGVSSVKGAYYDGQYYYNKNRNREDYQKYKYQQKKIKYTDKLYRLENKKKNKK